MRRSSKEYWSRAKTSGPHQASRTRVLPMTRSRNTTRWEVKCESKYILHRSSAGGRLKEGWPVANVCASVQSRRKHRVSRGVEATRWQSLHWTPSHRNEDLYLKLQILMREVCRMLKVHQLSVCFESNNCKGVHGVGRSVEAKPNPTGSLSTGKVSH